MSQVQPSRQPPKMRLSCLGCRKWQRSSRLSCWYAAGGPGALSRATSVTAQAIWEAFCVPATGRCRAGNRAHLVLHTLPFLGGPSANRNTANADGRGQQPGAMSESWCPIELLRDECLLIPPPHFIHPQHVPKAPVKGSFRSLCTFLLKKVARSLAQAICLCPSPSEEKGRPESFAPCI